MQRIRECNGPSYGGSECHGSWKESANCFLKDCPGKNETKLSFGIDKIHKRAEFRVTNTLFSFS